MRIYSIVVLLATLGAEPQTPVRRASIEGVVLDAETGKTITPALVMVFPPRNPNEGEGVSADIQGRFVLKDVEPGRRQLIVSAPGYATLSTTVSMAEGQAITNITMRLVSAGAISGRVLDSSGQPLLGISLSLFQYRHVLGEIVLSDKAARPGQSNTALLPVRFSGTGKSNDRGAYRFYDVPPGDYYLRFSQEQDSRQTTLGAVLYPGVVDESKAVPIRVHPGEEARLSDVLLTPSRMGWITARVSVPAIPNINPADYQARVSLRRLSDNSPIQTRTLVDSPSGEQLMVRPDGPGEYRVCVTKGTPGDASWNGELQSCQAVNYTGAPTVLNFQLLKPDGRLKGRILINQNDGAAPTPLHGALVAAILENGVYVSSESQADGSFDMARAGPLYVGSGRFARFFPPFFARPDYYVSAARQDGRDVLREGLRIDRNAPPIEILVSTNGGRLHGKIVDAKGDALPGATVVVIPQGTLAERTDRASTHRETYADQDGAYEIRGLIPGKYTAYAFIGTKGWTLWDADYLQRSHPYGAPVEVQEGGDVLATLKAAAEPSER